jgi:hypothetical protein
VLTDNEDGFAGSSAAIIPTIAAIQTDVGFANKYRLELIKTSLTVAAGLLAFTATFRPNLSTPQLEWLMWSGWLGLGVSTLGAMGNMYGWEQFYISYRDYKEDQNKGREHRRKITRLRRLAMAAQFGGFAIGVMSIAVFAAMNLGHVTVPPK